MKTGILTAILNMTVKTFFYPTHVGPGLGEEVTMMSELKTTTLSNPCLALYKIDNKWNLFGHKGLHSLCGVVADIRSITIAKNYIQSETKLIKRFKLQAVIQKEEEDVIGYKTVPGLSLHCSSQVGRMEGKDQRIQ